MKPALWTEWATTPGCVSILDACRPGCARIADAPSRVVDECLARYGEKRILFCDELGQWRELLHTGIVYRGIGEYSGMVPGRGTEISPIARPISREGGDV